MANYSQGAQVEHNKFGLGTVMSATDERIVIRFDDHGEKKFVTTMVAQSLKKSDRQPPAEKRGGKRKAKVVAPVAAVVEPDAFEPDALEADALETDAAEPDAADADAEL
ncbi:MAG: DUF3553 domain-containing protein [Acidobacteriia bacterium]|jgi:hypothetical protein|nr:DUF3553 domain-containing protein [Terriglobia bacterium]